MLCAIHWIKGTTYSVKLYFITGIFLTVDSVRFGYREADARNGWNALPPPHRLVNYDEEVARKTPGSRKKWLAPEASVDTSKIYDGEEGGFNESTLGNWFAV